MKVLLRGPTRAELEERTRELRLQRWRRRPVAALVTAALAAGCVMPAAAGAVAERRWRLGRLGRSSQESSSSSSSSSSSGSSIGSSSPLAGVQLVVFVEFERRQFDRFELAVLAGVELVVFVELGQWQFDRFELAVLAGVQLVVFVEFGQWQFDRFELAVLAGVQLVVFVELERFVGLVRQRFRQWLGRHGRFELALVAGVDLVVRVERVQRRWVDLVADRGRRCGTRSFGERRCR